MSRKKKSVPSRQKWVMTVVLLSFALSIVMSLLTSIFVESAGLFMALMTLLALILLGIATDMIGTAVTSADDQPFIAMASKRITGAKQALRLIRSAERVSSVLCDVVGDIVGIVSGTAGTVIAIYLSRLGIAQTVASVLLTAFTSAFMIGGKAYGKSIAIDKSGSIVLAVGRGFAFFEQKKQKRKSRNKHERGAARHDSTGNKRAGRR